MQKNEKLKILAKEIVEKLGGNKNISSITHCMTRLRIVLNNLECIDKEGIEKIEIVKGIFLNGGQLQIIIGNNVGKVCKIITEELDVKEVSKEELKEVAKINMRLHERILTNLAEIFVPLLPALICGGLILGLRNILGDIKISGITLAETNIFWKGIYDFLWLIGEAIFRFLPVGITWSVVRKMGGSQILGIILGITLVSPQLMNAYNIGKMVPEFWDFGFFQLEKVGYQAQVIPAILAGLTLSIIELKLNKIIHESVRIVIVPLISLVVTVFLAHSVIGPFGRVLGDGIGNIFQFLLTGKFAVIGSIIFGVLYAPLVITGLHHTTNVIEFILIQQIGGTMIFPLLALSNIAQASATLAMTFSGKNIKNITIPAAISAYLGVTEPALYGVNIKYRYPMICAMISSGIGAGICGLFGVMANSIGVGGLLGILTVRPQYWLVYLIAIALTCGFSFILTYLVSKNKKN